MADQTEERTPFHLLSRSDRWAAAEELVDRLVEIEFEPSRRPAETEFTIRGRVALIASQQGNTKASDLVVLHEVGHVKPVAVSMWRIRRIRAVTS